MIFPYGGSRTPDVLKLMEREGEWRLPPPIGRFHIEEPAAVCVSRAGVERDRHSFDKDRRCIFCDRKAAA